jgi:dUTPase
MPSTPPFVIKASSGYTGATLPSQSNNVITLYNPTSGIIGCTQNTVTPVDLKVQLIVPEGYVAIVNQAPGLSSVTAALIVNPTTITAQGATELTVYIGNVSTAVSNIPLNTAIAQVIFLKLTPAQPILSSS